MTCTLLHGDCLAVLREISDASVDAIVTDPPAGIGFMGREWDSDRGGRDQWIAWLSSVMCEALRVLKPGGQALVWALPRTSHWTATAIEDAGFEIRDVHHHIFGTGFPKSLTPKSSRIPRGTGTALKPAVEHWILARKPLEGTVADNLAAHGTGTLNIEACRIGTDGESFRAPQRNPGNRANALSPTDISALQFHKTDIDKMRAAQHESIERTAALGRWPAHLSLDEHGAAALDEQSGECPGMPRTARRVGDRKTGYGGGWGTDDASNSPGYGDTGGASRFFYVAKPARSERDRGLEELRAATGGEATGRIDGSAGTRNPRAGAGRTGGAKNIHPTVKSIALMRWLVRLVTPPGGLVLDMFTGSGSTGLACAEEGMRFLGIEREPSQPGAPDYHGIALRRLHKAYGCVETRLPEQRALDALLTPRRSVEGAAVSETRSLKQARPKNEQAAGSGRRSR